MIFKAALCLALASCSAQPALALVRDVTAVNFAAQIKLAVAGDVLNYSGAPVAASFRGKAGLTVNGGRFTSLAISGGTGLTFVDTVIVATPAVRHAPLLDIRGEASDISFVGVRISSTPRADGALLGYAVNLIGGARITFRNLDVTGTTKGMVASFTKELLVDGARLYRLRSDGIQTGNLDGATFLNIEVGQLIPNVGDHPDAFQGNLPSNRLTIRNFRFFSSGAGDGQGIFLSDAKPPQRYTNIVIENVNITAKFARCVSIDQADKLRLRNIVCTSRVPFIHRPGIYLKDVTGLDAADTVGCIQSRVLVTGADVRAFTIVCPQ